MAELQKPLGDRPSDVTELLERVRLGERDAEQRLLETVHDELRRLARRYMRQERPNHTLQPTALVNETYLRLFRGREIDWKGQSELLRCAARAMRQVLVDHARSRNRAKRGGDFRRVSLDSDETAVTAQPPGVLLSLDESLTRLAQLNRRQGEIVELLYFAGLTQDEAATALGISPRTVNREWRLARAWLRDEINKGSSA